MRVSWSDRQARGALAALAVSIAGVGFSAHASLSRRAVPLNTPVMAHTADRGATLPVATPAPAPAPSQSEGVTGTVALPPLPADAASEQAGVDGSIRPAAPFLIRGSMLDQARALQCLTTAIYYEAATEPDDGQAAVAQVILNRVRHPSFPGTVCGVVFQGSDRRPCQFSFACDGALLRLPARAAWDRARRVAARALAGQVFAPVGLATHYHTYAVTPAWNRGLVMTGMFGAHLFHRWKGWWGTPAAFSRPYAGGEPPAVPLVPARPLSPIAPAPEVAPQAAALLAIAPSAPSPAQPGFEGSGALRVDDAAGDDQILDKWKDVGKPLR